MKRFFSSLLSIKDSTAIDVSFPRAIAFLFAVYSLSTGSVEFGALAAVMVILGDMFARMLNIRQLEGDMEKVAIAQETRLRNIEATLRANSNSPY